MYFYTKSKQNIVKLAFKHYIKNKSFTKKHEIKFFLTEIIVILQRHFK